MAKEAEKRLIRTLEFLKEPQGSTIPTLVKTLNSDQPQISLKRIIQTLRGCQQSGILKVLDGRVKLRENPLTNSLQFCKVKDYADQSGKGKSKRGCGGKSMNFNKLDEIHSTTIGAKTKLSGIIHDSDHTRIPECDDDPNPPDSPESGTDMSKKKIRCRKKKKKPRCPKKKPKCPKKKPKCPKKKPKSPKKKPKCPKPKPKCPKPKPKCPKPKLRC